MEKNIQNKSVSIQKLYFLITIILVVTALFSFVWGVVESQTLQGVPLSFFEFLRIVWFYHIAHFIWGIVLLTILIRRNRRKLISLRIVKTIVSLILSPISFIILSMGILLLGLSSCSFN